MPCVGLSALLIANLALPPLAPKKYSPLPVGSVTPTGWLLTQLQLQADGLSGHLAQFWPDVQKSVWIGGGGDGGLHERTPYWLNGIVPLAFLLRNANATGLNHHVGIWKAPSPTSSIAINASRTRPADVDCGAHLSAVVHPLGVDDEEEDDEHVVSLTVRAVDVLSQVHCYISYILSHQADDGWLGPPAGKKDGNAAWARSNIMLSLAQYAEAMPTEFGKVTKAMLRYVLALKKRLVTDPLGGWAQQRWQDISLGVQWLLDHAPQGKESELLDLLHTLYTQGSDWEGWFEGDFAHGVRGANGHNVNNAQALKSAAVAYRVSRNASLDGLSASRVKRLDAHCGLPTGMYVGDEIIPTLEDHNPSRGIELCGVVEAMFSYSVMFSQFGRAADLDKAERIAFNALPATWASPKGGDMWAHQYLQAVNQIAAHKEHPHVWTHDGDDAERYGLAPNFGCCTANFNQGWPKLAQHALWMVNEDSHVGVAVGILAPLHATLPSNGTVEVDTKYPFEDEVHLTAKAAWVPFKLYVRVPGWAGGEGGDAELIVGSKPPLSLTGKNGTIVFVGWAEASGVPIKATLKLKPKLRIEQWAKGAYSIHRGPLMFSYNLAANFTTVAHHFGTDTQSNDYDVTNASAWQYALVANTSDPTATLTFERRELPALADDDDEDVAAPAPFNHSGWPVVVKATLRPLPKWGITLNSASVPPESPACATPGACGEPVQVELVPHGSSDLRIGQFPLA